MAAAMPLVIRAEATGEPKCATGEDPKTNIIYILADDMGYGDLSCLNENSKSKTDA